MVTVIILILLLTISLSAVMVHRPSYKYYKITYDALKEHSYVFNCIYTFDSNFDGSYYYDPCNGYNGGQYNPIIFFKDKSIRLISPSGTRNKYLHDYFVTYMDPYSLYWHIKIWRWFKKNKPVNTSNYR